jgi:hypothetical protein
MTTASRQKRSEGLVSRIRLDEGMELSRDSWSLGETDYSGELVVMSGHVGNI